MKTLRNILFYLLLLSHFTTKVYAKDPPFMHLLNDEWVNLHMDQMTTEEKIGQLLMVPVYPKLDENRKLKVMDEIKKWKIGGILVMQGTPVKTVRWINEFQEQSAFPLLVAIDGEWGPSMRIDSVLRFPYAQALGAVQDTTYLYQMGYDMGSQMKRMGIHVNFAPVADVNTNPANPVINFRSFGEDKLNVAVKAGLLARGMQDAGIAAVAKHFPGHGDTDTDSHKTLPFVNHSKDRIDEVETYPFRYLSDQGISGVMSAHLNVPSLDETGTPSSLSRKILVDYLKNEIGFTGFVVTDALNMKGVSQSGNVTLEAIMAGNDLAEFVPDVGKAVRTISEAIDKGDITLAEINEKCRKLLALKRWLKLNECSPAKETALTSALNSPYHEVTVRKLIKGSLTVLKNESILPVTGLDSQRIATVTLGGKGITPFQKMISRYAPADHFYLAEDAAERDLAKLLKNLKNYDMVIAGVEGIHIYPSGKYGTTEIVRRGVEDLIRLKPTIISFFGNAYALKHFRNVHHARGLILAYQNNTLVQELSAQLVFGAIAAIGKLPVTIDERFQLNQGIEIKKNDRLAYTIPEELGINSVWLSRKIDSIALAGVKEGAYPGCQVMAARDGSVFFHRCYGYHTYDSLRKVEKENIYDWASVTKVTAPLPALMKMVDEKKIDLDKPLSNYWTGLQNTDKENLKFREILAHQAGLQAWIPFWQMTLTEEGELDRSVFKDRPTRKFNLRVSENLYMNRNYLTQIMDTIYTSELKNRKKYLYSGLSFYLYPGLITNLSGKPYQDYLSDSFFAPLGAYSVTFNAAMKYPLNRIIPTEIDDFFRKEKLHGFVHDEGAAMMGGISGNAGLFGTTNDLAKIFQMYLQKGYYGGKRYISEKTVNEFTRIQFPRNENRRGLGFDKPLIDNHENEPEDAYPALDAAKESFGHSGYTGTFAWADPKNDLLFIFMSNRVYPTRENDKLYRLNIRTSLHQTFYDCLKTDQN